MLRVLQLLRTQTTAVKRRCTLGHSLILRHERPFWRCSDALGNKVRIDERIVNGGIDAIRSLWMIKHAWRVGASMFFVSATFPQSTSLHYGALRRHVLLHCIGILRF